MMLISGLSITYRFHLFSTLVLCSSFSTLKGDTEIRHGLVIVGISKLE